MKKVSIVGAGFSGLVSAFYLVRAGYTVEVFERSDRAGGLIGTRRLEGGTLAETAANALLNSTLVEELFSEIGVSLVGTLSSARKRFIFRGGRARRWPLGFLGTLGFAFFIFRYFLDRAAVAPRAGETVQAWGTRALGPEASQYLIDTALQGIYAGDPSRMSASLVVGRFFSRGRSRSRAPRVRGSVTPLGGMQELIDGLVAYLVSRGVQIHFGASESAVRAAMGAGAHPWIVATSAYDAASFVPSRAVALSRVQYSPVVTTTVLFRSTDSRSQGFGVLFPPIERRRALGVLKNNFAFPGRASSGFSETWIQGGALSTLASSDLADDASVMRSILAERSSVFGLNEQPVAALSTRWERGIPHYTVELESVLADLNAASGNVFLMGNYLGDIGLAKILERASAWPERLEKEGHWT